MEVIEEGPLTIMKANTDATTSARTPMVPKPRSQWTPEEKKKFNLDNVAKDIILKPWTRTCFLRLRHFENFKMKHGECIDEMDKRFIAIIDESTMLGQDLHQQGDVLQDTSCPTIRAGHETLVAPHVIPQPSKAEEKKEDKKEDLHEQMALLMKKFKNSTSTPRGITKVNLQGGTREEKKKKKKIN
ncbi:hypothetical protein Dimus_029276 [Dionaea muscipula]